MGCSLSFAVIHLGYFQKIFYKQFSDRSGFYLRFLQDKSFKKLCDTKRECQKKAKNPNSYHYKYLSNGKNYHIHVLNM